MKEITFKKLYIKNFLSIGDTPIEIDINNGITFITGDNLDSPGSSNAVGKSTIIDAFYFAIFGTTLRNLNKDQIVNKVTRKRAEVSLEFEVNSPKGLNKFVINRTIGPSSLTVYKDNQDKTRDSVNNTTKYILEVLSASTDVFKNCVIMRANNTVPFMAQSKPDKKKFIENLFSLDIITKMFKQIKDDFNSSKRDLDVESKLALSLQENLDIYKNKLSSQKNNTNNLKTSYAERIKELKNKIKEDLKEAKKLTLVINESSKKENEDKEKIEKIKKVLLMLKKSRDKVTKNIHILQSDINSLKNQLKEYDDMGDTCPVCHRKYDEESLKISREKRKSLTDKVNYFNQKLSECLNLKKDIDKKYNEKQISLDNFNVLYDELDSVKRQKANLISDINFNKKILDETLEKYNNISKNEDDNSASKVIKELIGNTEKDLEDKNKIVSDLSRELNKLEIAKFILSDEGVKSYIISKLLELLNFRIKYYLKKMGSKYQLVFDELFEDTITTENNSYMNYGNLSGAESKMLDLACIWSFRDILRLQGSVNYNIAFYDEILDSSMDAKNSEIVCNILNEFGLNENQAIFVISHKADLVRNLNSTVIKLKKQYGVTTLA